MRPGDSLYFLRDQDDCDLRVKATVVRTLSVPKSPDEDLSNFLKEMQPRLQITENQYNTWSGKEQALLVEFDSAQKMEVVHVAPHKIPDRSDWIAFEQFDLIT